MFGSQYVVILLAYVYDGLLKYFVVTNKNMKTQKIVSFQPYKFVENLLVLLSHHCEWPRDNVFIVPGVIGSTSMYYDTTFCQQTAGFTRNNFLIQPLLMLVINVRVCYFRVTLSRPSGSTYPSKLY